MGSGSEPSRPTTGFPAKVICCIAFARRSNRNSRVRQVQLLAHCSKLAQLFTRWKRYQNWHIQVGSVQGSVQQCISISGKLSIMFSDVCNVVTAVTTTVCIGCVSHSLLSDKNILWMSLLYCTCYTVRTYITRLVCYKYLEGRQSKC